MQKTVFFIFFLILVYLLLIYKDGTKQIGAEFFAFIQQIILYLQGRDSAGHQTGYA